MSPIRRILLTILLCIIAAMLTPILLCAIFIYKIAELFLLIPCLFGIHDYEQVGEYMLKCKRCGEVEVI